MEKNILGKTMEEWVSEFPIISDIMKKKETLWLNGGVLPYGEAILKSELQMKDIEDASDRLDRFRRYFKSVFGCYCK